MKSKDELHPLLGNFDHAALQEAQDFLHEVEERRKQWEKELAAEAPHEISAAAQRLIERTQKAFEGVTCYREVRVLLGGEAEDEYMSPAAQALLAPLEERDDWRDIPDSMLLACECSLSYAGAHAYRFLVPAFLCGELRGLPFNGFFPGGSKIDDSLWDLRRGRALELNDEQRACLSDYLSYEVLQCEWPARRQFMSWEIDEYRLCYADRMSLKEYGDMLVNRYRVKES